MTWAEVDLYARIWTIPADRMKAGKEHRVPLSNAAIALLGPRRDDSALVFESESKPGKLISDMSMTAVLRRMGRDGITVHGFRSTFRDWAGETTGFPRQVIEAALAHGIKDKAEAAYARSDLFDKRRDLMEAWAAVAIQSERGANVVTLAQQPQKPQATWQGAADRRHQALPEDAQKPWKQAQRTFRRPHRRDQPALCRV